MGTERHLNDDEFAELMASLREDLRSRASRSEAAWASQRALIRERLRPPVPGLHWAIVGLAAVIALSCGLMTLHRPAAQPAAQGQQIEDDDALLNGIQHTLAHRAPEPLMPASVLIQEIAKNSNHEQKRND